MSPKVLFTCFAGRERYLRVLVPYINTLVERRLVDEVHFWDYTRDPKDAEYIRKLPFQVLVPETKSNYGDYYAYYTCAKYPDPDTVLVKCDDDIVYIDVDHFDAFINARRTVPEALIFSPSVINNPVCGAIQLNRNLLPGFERKDMEISADGARKIHKYFLKSKKLFMKDSFETKRFAEIPLTMVWRFNINFVAILAKDFDTVLKSPYLAEDDECYLGVYSPRVFQRCIWLDLHFVIVHMAYTAQRDQGFDETEMLHKYHEMSVSHTRSRGGSGIRK